MENFSLKKNNIPDLESTTQTCFTSSLTSKNVHCIIIMFNFHSQNYFLNTWQILGKIMLIYKNFKFHSNLTCVASEYGVDEFLSTSWLPNIGSPLLVGLSERLVSPCWGTILKIFNHNPLTLKNIFTFTNTKQNHKFSFVM